MGSGNQSKIQDRADTESIYVDALRKMYMTLTPTSILEALGYRIKWHGIDPQSARVRKR